LIIKKKNAFIQNIKHQHFKFTLPTPFADPPCPGRGIFISNTFPNLEHSSRTSSNISKQMTNPKINLKKHDDEINNYK